MSYIHDALRRADAERERGSIPDLHAQPVPARSGEERSSVATAPWLPWAGGALGLALLAALAWVGLAHDEPPRPVVAARAPLPPPAPVAAPAPPPAPAATPKPAVTVVATPTPRATPAKPATRAEDVAAAPAPATPAASAGAPRIVAQRDLPEDVRRQLPPLAIGGSMYSDAPANRMLIINGQLFHEREQPAPGVVLEQIRLKSAVLGFKGYRFELSY